MAGSLEAARRYDQLAHRLRASESVRALIRLLFLLEGRAPPDVDELPQALAEIEALQDWPAGYLRWALLHVLSQPAPRRQLELARRVDRLLAARGLPGILDELGALDAPRAASVARWNATTAGT